MIRAHHQQAIDALTAHFKQDPTVLAVIIGGSVAHGFAREDSDIDFMLVVDDERYKKAEETGQFFDFRTEFTPYPGGYSDGKLITIAYLREAAAKASDPTRFAFQDAFVTYSKDPQIEKLVAEIATYPEDKHEARIKSFHAQVQAFQWFAGEADKRQDPYLMLKMAADMSLFACRLILTHNKIIYPYHKWLMTIVAKAADKPADFMEKVQALVAKPSKENADALAKCVLEYRDWGVNPNDWANRFFEDVEWTWRNGRPDIHEV